jgi:hypothetical protein
MNQSCLPERARERTHNARETSLSLYGLDVSGICCPRQVKKLRTVDLLVGAAYIPYYTRKASSLCNRSSGGTTLAIASTGTVG